MDTQNLSVSNAENVSGTATVSDTPKITKEEAQQMTDDELLQMVQKATGHTGKDFTDYMGCDFSYTYLTGLLKDRGYEMGWHKTSEGIAPVQKQITIKMKRSNEDVSRQSYMVEKSVAEEWKHFNKNVPYKSVTIGWALRRFMDDYNSGRIKFELEI